MTYLQKMLREKEARKKNGVAPHAPDRIKYPESSEDLLDVLAKLIEVLRDKKSLSYERQPESYAFNPNEPRDTRGEWTGGGTPSAPVNTPVRKEAVDAASSNIQGLLNEINGGTVTAQRVNEMVDGLKQSLSIDEWAHVLNANKIYGKPRSKSDAANKLRAVLNQQVEMWVKAQAFRSYERFPEGMVRLTDSGDLEAYSAIDVRRVAQDLLAKLRGTQAGVWYGPLIEASLNHSGDVSQVLAIIQKVLRQYPSVLFGGTHYERELEQYESRKELPSGGIWRMLGGKSGSDGHKHGGSRVYIVKGKIVAGGGPLAGKSMKALKTASSMRHYHKARKEGKEQWEKMAEGAGMNPKDLHETAAEFRAYHNEEVKAHNQIVQQAKGMLERQTGKGAQSLKREAAKGKMDEASVKGLDDIAMQLALEYPEVFGYVDPEAETNVDTSKLFDMLTEGIREPMDANKAYNEAFTYLMEHGDVGQRESAEPESSDALDDTFDFGDNAPSEPAPSPEQPTTEQLANKIGELGKANSGLVDLAELRDHFPGVGKEEMDQALQKGVRSGQLTMAAFEGRQGITDKQQASLIEQSHGQSPLGYVALKEQPKMKVSPAEPMAAEDEKHWQPSMIPGQFADSVDKQRALFPEANKPVEKQQQQHKDLPGQQHLFERLQESVECYLREHGASDIAAQAALIVARAELYAGLFDEQQHPRGQPENAGEFAEKERGNVAPDALSQSDASAVPVRHELASGFVNATTLNEAQDAASSFVSGLVDYTGIDVDVANIINKQINDRFSRIGILAGRKLREVKAVDAWQCVMAIADGALWISSNFKNVDAFDKKWDKGQAYHSKTGRYWSVSERLPREQEVASVCDHELGHFIHLECMNENEKSAWIGIATSIPKQEWKKLSEIASTYLDKNRIKVKLQSYTSESFAESVTAFLNGHENSIPPAALEFVRKILK